MTTYPYLEFYVILLSDCYSFGLGRTFYVGNHSFASTGRPPTIAISDGDQEFLSSVAMRLEQGQGMTQRQVDRALDTLDKLKGPLQAAGFGLPNEFQFALPIRKIDYTQSLSIEGDFLVLRSKYNEQLVESLRKFSSSVLAMGGWDHEKRVWKFSITEETVSWLVAQSQIYGIPIMDDVMDLFNLILECEQNKYAIELTATDGEVDISNAADSLKDWLVEHNIWGDLVKMADYSAVCAYTISSDVKYALKSVYGSRFVRWMGNRFIDCPQGEEHSAKMDQIIEWAKTVERFPIVAYNPNRTKGLTEFDKYFDESEILHIGLNDDVPEELPSNIKLIATAKSINIGRPIPLLISSVSLLFGTKAKELLSNTEKVVWNCLDIKRLTRDDRGSSQNDI